MPTTVSDMPADAPAPAALHAIAFPDRKRIESARIARQLRARLRDKERWEAESRQSMALRSARMEGHDAGYRAVLVEAKQRASDVLRLVAHTGVKRRGVGEGHYILASADILRVCEVQIEFHLGPPRPHPGPDRLKHRRMDTAGQLTPVDSRLPPGPMHGAAHAQRDLPFFPKQILAVTLQVPAGQRRENAQSCRHGDACQRLHAALIGQPTGACRMKWRTFRRTSQQSDALGSTIHKPNGRPP